MVDERTPQAEPAAKEPTGPPAPFWVIGSDGSERGTYPTLELAQVMKANLVAVHEGEGHTFTIRDKNGDPVG